MKVKLEISVLRLCPHRGHFSCDCKHCVSMVTGGRSHHMFHYGGKKKWLVAHSPTHTNTTDCLTKRTPEVYYMKKKAHCKFMKQAAAASSSFCLCLFCTSVHPWVVNTDHLYSVMLWMASDRHEITIWKESCNVDMKLIRWIKINLGVSFHTLQLLLCYLIADKT